MKTIIALSLAMLCPAAFAETSCQLTPDSVSSNLSLDWQTFDQTEGRGHRELAARGCFFEAATLTDLYHLHNLTTLTPGQDRILWWHAGQMYAMIPQNDLALSRFEKSINPAEPADSPLQWNAYANATIAFLKRDEAELRRQRDLLAAHTDQAGNAMNLRIIERMVRCPTSSYTDVYSGIGSCPQ